MNPEPKTLSIMKYCSRFNNLCFSFCLLFICLTSLTSCRTMRTSEKAVSESETASVTASRLTFYRTIDSLSKHLTLSFDSASIVFWPESPEFPRAYPSGIERLLETPADSSYKSAHQADGRPSIATRPRNALRSVAASRSSSSSRHKVPPDASQLPHEIKIYGLHVTSSSDKKSVEQADLKDSVTTVTQSEKVKSASKQSSDPSKAPKWIFLCLLVALMLYILYKIRR